MLFLNMVCLTVVLVISHLNVLVTAADNDDVVITSVGVVKVRGVRQGVS
jgi:hypothetical protein